MSWRNRTGEVAAALGFATKTTWFVAWPVVKYGAIGWALWALGMSVATGRLYFTEKLLTTFATVIALVVAFLHLTLLPYLFFGRVRSKR